MNQLSLSKRFFATRRNLARIFSLTLVVCGASVSLPAHATGANLIVNGSFEADGVQWTAGGVTGWTKVGGSIIEIFPLSSYGVTGYDGGLVLELSGDWPDPKTRIKQTVATIPGRTYTLSFLGGARDGGGYGDTINVYWGGSLLDSVLPTSSVMQQFSYTVTATGTTMDVEFESGEYDSVGSILDAVSMVAAEPFDLCLLYDPQKLHKSGSTVPIKLQLCMGGSNVSSGTLVLHATSLQKLGAADSGTPEDSGNANPDSDFRYDETLGETGGYIFNLSTRGLVSGEYVLRFQVEGESTTYEVTFQIK